MNGNRRAHSDLLRPLVMGMTGAALLAIFWQSAPQTSPAPSGAPPISQNAGAHKWVTGARLTPVGPSISGVSGSVDIKAGATPLNAMDVTVRYSVPPGRRLCIGASAFKNISLGPSPQESILYPKQFRSNSGGCIAHARDGRVSMTMKVHSNDANDAHLPALFWLQELPGTHQDRDANEDGFVVVTLQVGSEIQIDRIDSPFFARDAVKVAR